MFTKLAIAATLAVGAVTAAAPAMADRYCGPDFYYSRHSGECRPYAYREPGPGAVVGGAVAGAGYVAGSAVNAAGNVAGAAVNTAGSIVNGVFGR
jgi:hypothetical protein